MRISAIFRVSAAALVLMACDGTPSGLIAGISGTTATTAGSGIAISPNQVTMRIGGTTQLSTNVPTSQTTNIEWISQQSTIAGVSPSGLVTAIATGSTTITARLATDTTVTGSATITVTP